MTVIPRSTALSQKAIRSRLLSPSSARTLPPSLFLRTRLLHLSPLNMIGSRKLSTAALRYSNAASRSNLRWHWYSRRRLHHLQALRPISYSAVPKLAFRLLGRTSVAALGVGAGGVGYLSYKVDGFRQQATSVLSDLSNSVTTTFSSLSESATGTFSNLSESAADAYEGISRGAGKTLAEATDNLKELRGWLGETLSSFGSGGGDKGGEGENEGAGKEEEPPKPRGSKAVPTAIAVAASLPAVVDVDSEKLEGGPEANELMVLTRKLIEIRTILMSIDHGETLVLPSIVVIGSQSSGKSSVLEAIVGHEFLPKGNNMVTRRPIELTLVHTPPTPSDPRPPEYAEFPSLGPGRITDFKLVQSTLTDLNLSVPASEAVSPTPIQLTIHSPRVPDLSLVDLPGYVQISSMDQPDELKDKIAKLCEKYIRAPNIILAVCAADVDLANSPALRASRKVDPLGMRTIGVITKMDLVNPEQGADIISNERYPLSLGYVGVVCKAAGKARDEGEGKVLRKGDSGLQDPVRRQEEAYFSSHKAEFSRPGTMVGTDTLKRRLMQVLEQSMAASLHSISNAVALELEESSYQFKVQYNDRSISAESYVAETMDALKARISEFSKALGKPVVRKMIRTALDEKCLDILAGMYWGDSRLEDLSKLAKEGKIGPDGVEPYWNYKLEAATSSLTKSGVGRTSTQLVVDAIRSTVSSLGTEEPLVHHADASERISSFADSILRDRFSLTSDQVENCVKPFKYEGEVEIDSVEWEEGRKRSIGLLEREEEMCEKALKGLKDNVGWRRLSNAINWIKQEEEREKRRNMRRLERAKLSAKAGPGGAEEFPEPDEQDPTAPSFNPNLLVKAREAIFLTSRSEVLKLRLAALKSKRCRGGPDNKAFCPEVFLNIVADKLAYTAVMFINIELLAEFFYQFPREIDTKLGYELKREEVAKFAKENPIIRRHLDLQERKEKLEMVHERLNDLVKLQQEKQAPKRHERDRRGFFGMF